MKFRHIGAAPVSAIGLGTMPMSLAPTPGAPKVAEGEASARAIATIHAALDVGITLLDTADAYTSGGGGQGSNELLVAEALRTYSGDATTVAACLVATKGGLINRGTGPWEHNGQPAYLKQAARASLARLGGDALGLYQLHRPDPAVPYSESVGALRELIDEGVVRAAGVSNVTVAQIEIARGVLGHHLVSVQNEFSPSFRRSAVELEHCTRHRLAFLAWSPLGGIGRAGFVGARTSVFGGIAQECGVSPQRVALAWELGRGDNVIPIVGASRVTSILDSASAVDLQLTPEQWSRLDAAPSLDISAY